MAHLLAINVPVKRDPAWSDWAKMTRAKIKSSGIPVSRWQLLYYHMTILFLDDDACAETFTPEFAKLAKACPALPMTIDKIDAFTATNGAEHIIYLSPTNVPEQILTLAKDAHVPADKMSLEELQTILQSLEQPAFHCVIKEAEHRYRRPNGTIKNWKLR